MASKAVVVLLLTEAVNYVKVATWNGLREGHMDYRQGIIDIVRTITQESALEFFYALILIVTSDEETMQVIDEHTISAI